MRSTERPAIAEPHLIRPRLHALLDEGVQRAVTTVQAGPGWGKTTLVAGWAGGQPRTVAWLTLGRRHATVPEFCSGVAAALNAAFPPAAVAGRFGYVANEAALRRLAAGFGRPVPLVLDDLHAIDGSPALRVLAALIRRQPAGLRLMLLSRNEPDLPLHVPRATGGLYPIGAADLRFDDGEAAALVGQLQPALPVAEITALAEGWPVALRLAAAAGTADPGEVIGDYLSREVLAGQTATVRRFLTRTSIVEEVNEDLAGALTGGAAGRRILPALQRTTGLVIGTRYHRLLRAELRRRLEREAPDEVAALHARAARWYAGAGMAPEALRHAADAEDWEYLSHLVVTLAPGLSLSPQRAELAALLQRIPPELLPTTPEFVVCAALLVLFDGDFGALPSLIGRARELLLRRPPDERVVIGAIVDLIEASALMRVTGDMPGMVLAIDRILDRLPEAERLAVPIAAVVRAVATVNKGLGLLWTLRPAEARQHLHSGSAQARDLGLLLSAVNAESHLALMAYFDGNLREAEKRACAAYRRAERFGATGTIQVTGAYLALALVEVERDRLVEAQAVLREARHSQTDPAEATLAVVSMLVRAHLAIAGGDHVAAAAALRQARDEVAPSLRAPLIERWLDAVECEIDLLAGHPARVVDRLRDVPGPSPAELLILGRAFLALGHRSEGENLLTRVTERSDVLSAVSAWIALARSAEARGDAARSTAAMARAVALAEPAGITRPFRALGAEHLRPAEQVLEPLTEREFDVLRFLPSVLTANEIAEELGVSVNTIKAHLRSIYRKLDASRRREAVTRARRSGLL
ncbi:LuxR C-terminal-related transcriptional regulator [Actinoplanes sp. NPDC023936]|uniref:helix-turn-helix transcriptional regulator n=1 Tax=Actinoplanes sp. NPDC023936 TaxID=3154910 RepID=UPI0033F9D063